MKSIRLLLLVTIMIATTGVYAQNNSPSDRKQEHKRTTQMQRSFRRQKQQHSNRKNRKSTNHRMITVISQPQKTHKQVDRSRVIFKKQVPRVVTMRRPSHNRGMEVMWHNNRKYYYKSGLFYSLFNNEFVKVAAPVGLKVTILPEGYASISLKGKKYFYYEGTFYCRSNSCYVVEKAPVGAIVYALPVDYEKVEIDGEILYEYNGILYERIRYNGERAYQVVGSLD